LRASIVADGHPLDIYVTTAAARRTHHDKLVARVADAEGRLPEAIGTR